MDSSIPQLTDDQLNAARSKIGLPPKTKDGAIWLRFPGEGWKRVLVVTSPTHTRRTRATFRDAGLTAIPVSSSEPRYDTGLRLPADRLRSLEAIVRELAGLLKYGANGWL